MKLGVRTDIGLSAVCGAACAVLVFSEFRRREVFDQSWDWQVALKAFALLCLFGLGVYRHLISGVLAKLGVLWLYPVVILYGLVLGVSNGVATPASISFPLSMFVYFSSVDRLAVGVFIVYAVSLCVSAGSLFAAVFMPDFAFMIDYGAGRGQIYRLAGITNGPNAMALTCLVLLTSALMAHRVILIGRRQCILAVMVSVALLLLTNSRAAMISLVVAAGYVLVRKSNVALMAACVGVVLSALVGFLPLVALISRGDAGAVDVWTLTGRTYLWTRIAERIDLLGGNGIGSMAILVPEVSTSRWAANHAHNWVLGILIELGVPGLLVFLVIIGGWFWVSVKLSRRRGSLVFMWPFIFFAVRSMVDTCPMVSFASWDFLFLVLYFGVNRRMKEGGNGSVEYTSCDHLLQPTEARC